MSKLRTHQTVKCVIDEIYRGAYQLPSIQRPFVWESEQVLRLLDSVMCEYPIGAVMVWKPPTAIRCRPFLSNYSSGRTCSQLPSPNDERAYMVLDGQQRLQSLYLAFHGVYEGRRVYLRIDGHGNLGHDELHFKFDLLSESEAASGPAYVLLSELAELDIQDIHRFVRSRLPSIGDREHERAVDIVSAFVARFVVKEAILIQEVSDRLDYNDVLEVFGRVNSGGTQLSKSDLLFSTVTLRIPDMEDRFATFKRAKRWGSVRL